MRLLGGGGRLWAQIEGLGVQLSCSGVEGGGGRNSVWGPGASKQRETMGVNQGRSHRI